MDRKKCELQNVQKIVPPQILVHFMSYLIAERYIRVFSILLSYSVYRWAVVQWK